MAYHLWLVDDSATMRRVVRKTVTLAGDAEGHWVQWSICFDESGGPK